MLSASRSPFEANFKTHCSTSTADQSRCRLNVSLTSRSSRTALNILKVASSKFMFEYSRWSETAQAYYRGLPRLSCGRTLTLALARPPRTGHGSAEQFACQQARSSTLRACDTFCRGRDSDRGIPIMAYNGGGIRNCRATAKAPRSSVSSAIFCASITSPGTRLPSGTKHQPLRGLPDRSSSITFVLLPCWMR